MVGLAELIVVGLAELIVVGLAVLTGILRRRVGPGGCLRRRDPDILGCERR